LPSKSKNSHRAPPLGRNKLTPAGRPKKPAGARLKVGKSISQSGGKGTSKPTSKPTGRPQDIKSDSKAPSKASAKQRGGKGGAGRFAAVRRSQGRVEALPAPTPAPATAKASRETARSLEAAKAAIDAALDKKCLLPVLIDVSGLASYTDFIGIVSGRSDRHVDAIADGVLQVMKARGRTLLGQEGSGSGRWALLDFGDVVIHVFFHPVREFYDLESLWVDAPRLPLKVPPEAMIAQSDALYGAL
jgi:ribosome-associated protein